mmetsp:Transcript_52390/g.59330  ORF Transcript_52390/g.59330 Transcript_52390/m.59330 type:complete len:82 (-) Transcript_52390:403-648(-)
MGGIKGCGKGRYGYIETVSEAIDGHILTHFSDRRECVRAQDYPSIPMEMTDAGECNNNQRREEGEGTIVIGSCCDKQDREC